MISCASDWLSTSILVLNHIVHTYTWNSAANTDQWANSVHLYLSTDHVNYAWCTWRSSCPIHQPASERRQFKFERVTSLIFETAHDPVMDRQRASSHMSSPIRKGETNALGSFISSSGSLGFSRSRGAYSCCNSAYSRCRCSMWYAAYSPKNPPTKLATTSPSWKVLYFEFGQYTVTYPSEHTGRVLWINSEPTQPTIRLVKTVTMRGTSRHHSMWCANCTHQVSVICDSIHLPVLPPTCDSIDRLPFVWVRKSHGSCILPVRTSMNPKKCITLSFR